MNPVPFAAGVAVGAVLSFLASRLKLHHLPSDRSTLVRGEGLALRLFCWVLERLPGVTRVS